MFDVSADSPVVGVCRRRRWRGRRPLTERTLVLFLHVGPTASSSYTVSCLELCVDLLRCNVVTLARHNGNPQSPAAVASPPQKRPLGRSCFHLFKQLPPPSPPLCGWCYIYCSKLNTGGVGSSSSSSRAASPPPHHRGSTRGGGRDGSGGSSSGGRGGPRMLGASGVLAPAELVSERPTTPHILVGRSHIKIRKIEGETSSIKRSKQILL